MSPPKTIDLDGEPEEQPGPQAESFETARPVHVVQSAAQPEPVPENAVRSAPQKRQPRSLPAAIPDRSPPHSAEAEEHVIAVCLLDGEDTLERATEAGLTPESFYFPANRLLFEILLDLRASRRPLSLETLAEELKTRRQLESVGGFAYLMQVTGKIPTTAHAGYFIEKVREKAVLRNIIKAASGAVEQAYSFSGGLQEYTDTVRDSIDRASSGGSPNILEGRFYDAQKEIPEPPALFRTKDTVISTPGNLTALYAESKAGKSTVVGAALASTFVIPGAVIDTLGIAGPNPDKAAVIHIDTEQSRFHWQKSIKTACKRAGLDAPPPYFTSVCMTGLPAPDIRRSLRTLLKKGKQKHGKVHSLFLDGVADAVINVNDPEECFPFVTELHGLAIEFDCAIWLVLHINPRSETNKGRGHLGSQLERKAESNLTLEMNGDVSLLYALKQRGKAITKENALAFRWDDAAKMHVSADKPAATPQKNPLGAGRKRRYNLEDFECIMPLGAAKGEGFRSLHRKAKEFAPHLSVGGFFDIVETMVDMGTIVKDRTDPRQPKYYRKIPEQPTLV